jgi:hypothetical protein
MQMLRRVLVELQRARQRVEDLCRGVVVAALLKANEIIDAHTGEQRKLLAAKARRTATAVTRQPRVFRGDSLAPRAQKLAQVLRRAHQRGRYSSRRRRKVALRFSGSAGIWLPRSGDRTLAS